VSSKRIAIVLQTPKDQHSSVYLTYQGLAVELTNKGHQVAIVTPQDFPLARRTAGRWTPLIYPLIVARWMRREGRDCDVAIFHSYAGWRAVSVAAKRGVASVVAFHGLEPMYHQELVTESAPQGGLSWRYRWLQERLMPMFLRRACRGATLITCLNAAEREALTRMGWAAANQISVVSHGVGRSFCARPRGPRRPTTLLFVGQWLPMKGVAYLTAAFEQLARRHPDLRLVCAGTLTPRDDVLAAFDEPVRSRITVMPRVDQPALASVYRDADIFVFPSSYEGFGLAIVEAMAGRLPIVTTPVGVAADALSDGTSALFVPRRSADAIVAAVERIIADDSLRARLAEGAQQAALDYRESETVRAWAHTVASIDRLS
jgi:glycosyltransferase involved in cell wall biosynthesis